MVSILPGILFVLNFRITGHACSMNCEARGRLFDTHDEMIHARVSIRVLATNLPCRASVFPMSETRA